MRPVWAFPIIALLALAACKGSSGGVPEGQETEVPKDLATFNAPKGADEGLGTPREQRVATLGLLNKRNNLTQDIQIKPGESKRVGDVIVRLATCERTPPWELPPETGAFVQVLVAQRSSPGANPKWLRVFSGWLFKNSPSLNVVEHPIYDVWVKDCAMSFPGDEAPLPVETGAPRPAASPAPSPSASASTPA
jgi:hypothetical protein